MTVLCGGGTSAAKPGAGAHVVVTGGAITELLIAYSLWLLPFALLVDAFIYDLTQECPTDPPPIPTFNLSDVSALTGGAIGPGLDATLAKVHDWLLNLLWPVYCECTSGLIPPAVAQLPPPAGVNSPPTTSTGGVCMNDATVVVAAQLAPDILTPYNQVPSIRYGFPDTRPQFVNQRTFQSAPTLYAIDATLSNHGEGTNPAYFMFQPHAIDTVGTILQFVEPIAPVFIPPGQTRTQTWHFLSATPYNQAGMQVGYTTTPPGGPIFSGTPTNTAAFSGNLYCQNPNTPLQPCCPPDPSLSTGINLIANMVQQLANQINVGFLHLVDQTRHAGLSGTGSIVLVAACQAIRVEIKNLPPAWPNNPGTPPYLFSAGFITSIVNAAPLKGWRLVYDTQTYPVASYADQIGYTLAPGLIVDIVEQIAGP